MDSNTELTFQSDPKGVQQMTWSRDSGVPDRARTPCMYQNGH
jgi:hypothetical protein